METKPVPDAADTAPFETPDLHMRIQRTRGWRALGLAEVWAYRELMFFFIWRELKGRYRQMALGPLWIILAPVISSFVVTNTLGRMGDFSAEGTQLMLFILSGQIIWRLFNAGTANAAGSLVTNMRLISKVYFPRLIVPLTAVFSALVDLIIGLVPLAAVAFYYRESVHLGWHMLLAPVFVLWAMAAALAVGLWLASLNVKFRDVRFAVTFILGVWIFLTPVFYDADKLLQRLPPWLPAWLYRINPLVDIVEGFRWSLLGIGNPPGASAAVAAGVVLVLLVSGAYVFRRTERTIVDLL